MNKNQTDLKLAMFVFSLVGQSVVAILLAPYLSLFFNRLYPYSGWLTFFRIVPIVLIFYHLFLVIRAFLKKK